METIKVIRTVSIMALLAWDGPVRAGEIHEAAQADDVAKVKVLQDSGVFEIDSRASYKLPAGWTVEKTARAIDPALRLSRPPDVIWARLFGGTGSHYATPDEYLGGIEASTMGRPPETNEVVTVSSIKTRFYRHGYPINLGDPHEVNSRPPQLATEQFCIVPASDRFFVLGYAHESLLPELSREGDEAWQGFLQSFRLLNPIRFPNTNAPSRR
jgi:hypothetical protein